MSKGPSVESVVLLTSTPIMKSQGHSVQSVVHITSTPINYTGNVHTHTHTPSSLQGAAGLVGWKLNSSSTVLGFGRKGSGVVEIEDLSHQRFCSSGCRGAHCWCFWQFEVPALGSGSLQPGRTHIVLKPPPPPPPMPYFETLSADPLLTTRQGQAKHSLG